MKSLNNLKTIRDQIVAQEKAFYYFSSYSTVTLFARFLGISTFNPLSTAT